MKYLLKNLHTIRSVIGLKPVVLFLDFDGTLAPIAQKPDQARMPSSAREIVSHLVGSRQVSVVVISGRSLEDVRKMVGIKGIIYAGNHGIEIAGPEMNYKHEISDEYKMIIEKLRREIGWKLMDFPGTFIEDKTETLSVHYRLLPPERTTALDQLLYGMTQPFLEKGHIRLVLGKKVLEIRPACNWDKGKAVEWILQHRQGVPIYLGDDTTDEDAFDVLKDKGIGIHVGQNERSQASYYLNNTGEVVMFLQFLCEVMND